MGKRARPAGRPAAGLGALRGEVLDARDDGDGPQRRPQRRVRARARRDGRRRRALRLRLLPPAAADVRRARCSASRRRCSTSALDALKEDRGPRNDVDLDVGRPRGPGRDVQGADPGAHRPGRSRRTRASSSTWPSRAVFDSWNTERAVLYRRQERIPERPRHRGQRLLDGVRQPRRRLRHRRRVHPRPGVRRAGRLRRLPAERAGRGRRRGHPQHRAARRPRAARQDVVRRAARHHGDARGATTGTCATSSSPSSAGKLWMLQTRVGKRTAEAAFRIACQLVDQGLIDMDEARAAG